MGNLSSNFYKYLIEKWSLSNPVFWIAFFKHSTFYLREKFETYIHTHIYIYICIIPFCVGNLQFSVCNTKYKWYSHELFFPMYCFNSTKDYSLIEEKNKYGFCG